MLAGFLSWLALVVWRLGLAVSLHLSHTPRSEPDRHIPKCSALAGGGGGEGGGGWGSDLNSQLTLSGAHWNMSTASYISEMKRAYFLKLLLD